MNLPSITQFISKSSGTFKRFPFAILSAILGVYYSIKAFDMATGPAGDFDELLIQGLMTCALGLPLFVAIALFFERRGSSFITKIIASMFSLGLLFWYYFINKGQFLLDDLVRFWVINAGLHFLVAFAPFIAKNEINGFWQFNKTLFIRFIVSTIYTIVLFVGLFIAMMAINKLLGANIPEKYNFYLWVVLAGIFNTWFFLSGVPEDFEELNQAEDYPKGLKIFTQYVLLPLVTIYLAILYLYIFKILVSLSLPHGWTSTLVICFSTIGVLSLLLIYPIKEKEENKWMKVYSKWFYQTLFPLIVLMFISIIKRVQDYGITEERYYVVLLACWLTFVAIYFTFSKKKNIKIIPISLALICFVSVYGPWSASSVSVHSQYERLVAALNKEKLIQNNKIVKTGKPLDTKVEEHILSQIQYLVSTHGIQAIQPLFVEKLDSSLKKNGKGIGSRYMDSYTIQNIIREKYLSELPYNPEPVAEADTSQSVINKRMTIWADNSTNSALHIGGYGFLFNVEESFTESKNNTYEITFENRKKMRFHTEMNKAKGVLSFVDEDKNTCTFYLSSFMALKRKADSKNFEAEENFTRTYPQDSMIIYESCPKFNMQLDIKSVGIIVKDHSIDIDRITATVLIRLK